MMSGRQRTEHPGHCKAVAKRIYDDKRRKRLLYVMITTWRGISVGAKHYYAKVYEDDNPILHEGSLVYRSDDKECKGAEYGGIMDTSFGTLAQAINWVAGIVVEHFPKHKLFDVSGGYVTLSEIEARIEQIRPKKKGRACQ